MIFVGIKKRADICFIIDSSTNIIAHDPNNWSRVKAFVKLIISQFIISSDGVRIAVVLFSTKAHVSLKLNEEHNVERILRRIDTLPHLGGSRNMSGGLYLMNHVVFRSENGDRPDADNIVILITSGRSTVNRDTLLYAKEAKGKGVKIVAVAITIFDQTELFTVVSPPVKQTLVYVVSVTKLVYFVYKVIIQIANPPGMDDFVPTSFTTEVPPVGESIICLSKKNTTL